MKLLAFTLSLIIVSFSLDAQKISATLNVQAFDINKTDADNANLKSYDGNVSFSGNLRFYTDKKWAYRIGAGWENIEYKINDGLDTDYAAKRNNYTAIFGLEKHFNIAMFDIYPGVYIPVTYKGSDKLIDGAATHIFDGVSNGDFHAGLGFMTGVNLKILSFLRIGAEFNLGYEQFKQDVVDNFNEGVKIKNIGFSTDFVIGIAF